MAIKHHTFVRNSNSNENFSREPHTKRKVTTTKIGTQTVIARMRVSTTGMSETSQKVSSGEGCVNIKRSGKASNLQATLFQKLILILLSKETYHTKETRDRDIMTDSAETLLVLVFPSVASLIQVYEYLQNERGMKYVHVSSETPSHFVDRERHNLC